MDKEKSIKVLNSLVTINNDRIEGYETAAKASDEHDLKAMFAKFTATSQKCKQELETEVRKLGGKPSEGTKASGKFFRAWMDVKAALTGKDRKAILNSCDTGEEAAVDAYQKALKNDVQDLTMEQQTMLSKQHVSIKTDHDHVKALRDALVEA